MIPAICRRNLVYLVDRPSYLEVVFIVFFGSNYVWDESLNVMKDLHNLLILQNAGLISIGWRSYTFFPGFSYLLSAITWLSAAVQVPGLSFQHLQSVMARCTRACILIHKNRSELYNWQYLGWSCWEAEINLKLNGHND